MPASWRSHLQRLQREEPRGAVEPGGPHRVLRQRPDGQEQQRHTVHADQVIAGAAGRPRQGPRLPARRNQSTAMSRLREGSWRVEARLNARFILQSRVGTQPWPDGGVARRP